MKIVPKSLTFAALALVAVTATAASRPAWISQVVQTEGGGHRMGNPKAKVAVIEFSSYTCPHCATFHKQSEAPLKLAYVSNGKASVEVFLNPAKSAAQPAAKPSPASPAAASPAGTAAS